MTMPLIGLMFIVALPSAPAAEQPIDTPQQAVAARVDGQPIFVTQVERELAAALGNRTFDPSLHAGLRQQVLRQLIDRRLAHQYLDRTGQGASPAEVDRDVQRLVKRAEQQEISWAQFLHAAGLGEAELRERLGWQIAWGRFLEKHATDQNLERYFQQNRREFDGTQLRVAHILLTVDDRGNAEQLAGAVSRARQIRQQIESGELDFADAAAQHSRAPTADSRGEIGFIGRQGPMPEPFSAAAFALAPGQLSEPVVTAFGVHLIRCLDERPGGKTWQQVRGDLYQAVTRHLFQWAADHQREQSVVQIEPEGAPHSPAEHGGKTDDPT